jgi:hypothetical protein
MGIEAMMGGPGPSMSESDLDVLEMKNNDAIAALLQSINTTVTQAPPPTQV